MTNARNLANRSTDFVSVRDFGARGDGVTDDTAAINAALTFAATNARAVSIPPGTYLHTGQLVVKNGVKALVGLGGVLKAGGNGAGVLLAGIQAGQVSNVSNCDVRDLSIDGNGYTFVGIHGQNAQNCNVTGNSIYNITNGYGILFRTYLVGARNTQHINLSNNRVQLTTVYYVPSSVGIALDVLNAELNVSPYADSIAYYQATFTNAASTYFAEHCVISDNVVSGGYYGISLACAKRTAVTGNALENNTRNISIQHVCQWNTVNGNSCSLSASSGIHLSQGSSFNAVVGNNIRGQSSGGDALIQMHLGSQDNLVANNQIVSDGTTGNEFFIYIGPKCDRAVIEGNSCYGNIERVGICIESDWNPSVTNQYSYAYGKTLAGNSALNYNNTDMTGVVVRGNLINLTFLRPAIGAYAVGGPTYTCDITGAFISENTVTTLPFYQFEIYEYNSAVVSTMQLTNNSFNLSSASTQFILPRGWSHFSNRQGNGQLDTAIVTFTNGDTTPSVKYGSTGFLCGNSSATSITFFDDGAADLEITVKLDVNTTIVHNNSFIRLKGSVNITGVNANNFVTLRQYSNIWYETSRNF